ncbi:RDD family protein [Solilutibacter pythonis]|nr:RDD family protein [Lysobacter pythonis]
MERHNWYYLDSARKRQGPLDTQQLRLALHNGEAHADMLAWREGMEAWKPLRDIAEFAELAATRPAPAGDSMATPAARSSGDLHRATDAPPPGRPHEVVHAGFWRRWAALFLDQLAISIPLIGLTLLFGFLNGAFRNIDRGQVSDLGDLYLFLYPIIAALYYSLQESGRHQATLGKRALNIKVTDTAGKPIKPPRALLRWMSASLSYLTLCIGFIMAAFTPEKKALHDVMAKTLVVDKWAFTPYPERQRGGRSGCLVVLVALAAVSAVGLAVIVAAFALSAYVRYATKDEDYLLATTQVMRMQIQHFHDQTGRCPVSGEDSFTQPRDYRDYMLQAVEFGPTGNGGCALRIDINGQKEKPPLVGQMTMEYRPDHGGVWRCSAHGLPNKSLPEDCR